MGEGGRIARSRIQNDERGRRVEGLGGRRSEEKKGLCRWLRRHTHAGAPFFLLSFIPASRSPCLPPPLPITTPLPYLYLLLPPPAFPIRVFSSRLGACTSSSSRPGFPASVSRADGSEHVRDTQWHIWC